MSSMYNVAADLRVNNTAFIAGFAAAEASIKRFNGVLNNTVAKTEASLAKLNRATANISTSHKAMGTGAQALSSNASLADNSLRKVEGASNTAKSSLDKLGGVATAVGKGSLAAVAVGAAGIYKTLDTFSKYESALAGVKKVVEGTDKDFRKLDLTFRKMTRTMPATYEEIANTAEVAGQLGIAKKDIEKFTKTMIMMGTSTNLTSEEAATSLAQMMNVMGTSKKDVDKLASTIVKLGNAGASSEKDIVNMAMRLTGMGKELDMSESDVLALSTVLSDLGISAEMGGSAVSKAMSGMKMSLEKASDYKEIKKRFEDLLKAGEITKAQFQKNIEKLNKDSAAGMQFAKLLGLDKPNEVKNALKLYEKDAYGALTKMVEGLDKVKSSGGNVTQTLQNMKINDVQALDTFKRMIGNADKLKSSVKAANGEWNHSTALTTEASKRYKTFESQVKMAWNGIRNIMANIGQAFAKSDSGMMETIVGIINKIEKMTDKFIDAEGNISKTGKTFVDTTKKIGAVVGIMAAVAGGFMMFGPAGATTVAVIAGIGVIYAGFDKLYKKIDPNKSGFQKSMDILDSGLSDVTKGKAEAYVKMADKINSTLTAMSIDASKVSKKTKKQLLDDIKSLTDEIIQEINAKESKILGINERLMKGATGGEKAMLENANSDIKQIFKERRKLVKDAQAELSKTLSKAQSGKALNQDDYMSMEVVFSKLDKEYSMHVSKNVKEMAKLDRAFDELGDNASLEKVQANFTKYAKATASSLGELKKGYESQREAILSSIPPGKTQTAMLASLAKEYDNNRVGILGNLSAYEKKAVKVNKNVDAMKGLSSKEKEMIGVINESTGAIVNNEKAYYGLNGGQEALLNGSVSIAQALSDASTQAESSQAHVDALAEKYTGLGNAMIGSLQNIVNTDMTKASEVGAKFATKMKDGTMMVDMGSAGTMKVSQFIAGVRSGDVTLQQAAIAQVNALKAQYGATSLTPEGEQKVLQFANGLASGNSSVNEIAKQLGFSVKSGVDVDLGPMGQVSTARFAEGLKSGEFGVAEVMAYFSEKLKTLSKVDLQTVGQQDIATLQTGISNGFISADQVIKTFTLGMKDSTKVNLTGVGSMNIATLKKGVQDGSIPLADAVRAIRTSTSDGFKLDNTERGKHAGDTFKVGINSKKPEVTTAAASVKDSAKNEFAKANDGGGGKKAGKSFFDGIMSWLSQVFGAGTKLKSNARNGMSGANTNGLGKDFGQGYINGILSKANDVWNAAKNLASRAWNAIKRTQRSNSPAKVTMGLGGDFGDGYVIGIGDKTSDAIGAAKSLATGAINAMNSEASKNAFALNDVMMPAGGTSTLENRVTHAMNTTGSVEISGKQPAEINVNIGGQEFNTFTDNIHSNNVKRLNLKESYSV